MLGRLARASHGVRMLRHSTFPIRHLGAAAAAIAKPATLATQSTGNQAFVGNEMLVNKLYELAQGNLRDPQTLSPLLDEACADVHTLTPDQMAKVALSMAMLGAVHKPMLHKIGDAAVTNMNKLTAQDAATLAWSLAALNAYNRRVFAALARRATCDMDTMSLQASAKMVSAFAKCHDCDRGLFVAVTKRTRSLVNEYRPQDLAMVTDALAKAGRSITGTAIFKTIVQHIRDRLGAFQMSDLCTICNALHSGGHVDHILKERVVELMVGQWVGLSDGDKEDARQLMRTLGVKDARLK